MAGLPINIPIPAESAIATYNYEDIINGFGYASLYLSVIPGAYSLSPVALVTVNTAELGSTAGFTSSPFSSPRVLNGRVFFEFGGYWTYSGGGNRTTTVSGELKKVSGGATTSLGTFTNYTRYQSSASGVVNGITYLDVTNIMLKIGDYLIFDFTNTTAAGGSYGIYADPKTTSAEQTKLRLPFKIQL